MNEQLSEQVFDSLLREVITNTHPPDLTERIVAAWRASQQGNVSDRPTSAPAALPQHRCEGDEPGVAQTRPGGAAHLPVEGGAGPLADSVSMVAEQRAPQSVDVSPAARSRATERQRLHSPGFWMVVAAASIAVAVAMPSLIDRLNKALPDHSRAEMPVGEPEKGTVVPEQSLPGTPDQRTRIASDAQRGRRATDLRDSEGPPSQPELFPIDPGTLAERASDPDSHDGEPGARVDPLPEDQILADTNRVLQRMWADVGVSPTTEVAPVEFVQRAHRILLGSDAPAPLVHRVALAGEQARRSAIIDYLLEQEQFSQAWADRWTNELLRRSAIPPQSDAGLALRGLLADSLRRGVSWGNVVEELLAADLQERSGPPTPQQTLLRALAGGGNHRLIRRIGSHFMATNLACVRCHDHRVANGPAQGIALDRQASYWSLAALLSGVEARRDQATGKRIVVDRQTEMLANNSFSPVFFDRLDGRLQAAEPRLPDGRLWTEIPDAKTPRQALARWIVDSDLLDRAVVNQTWRLMLGRHLVPPVAEVEPVAYAHRVELEELLAHQFRAHGRDVKALVEWIARSDAFARAPGVVDPAAGLLATDEQLLEWKLREAVFAAAPSLGQGNGNGDLVQSLASVVRWISNPPKDQRETMLAQPLLKEAKPGERRQQSADSLQLPPLGFVIHREVPTPAEQAFVRRLLSADRLSWEQRVAHIVELSDTEVASGRVQELAKQLLQHRHGDMEQALYDVLWAVHHASALQ
ncbi:MAG: DUF1549 domain-containing protein [Planctomycetota bacterium]|nr:MAG: DUF1549 domain-containing protein [Planctomycetota bacterium]